GRTSSTWAKPWYGRATLAGRCCRSRPPGPSHRRHPAPLSGSYGPTRRPASASEPGKRTRRCAASIRLRPDASPYIDRCEEIAIMAALEPTPFRLGQGGGADEKPATTPGYRLDCRSGAGALVGAGQRCK